MAKFTPVVHDADFVRRVMKKPGVKAAYGALSEEYALLRGLLRAGLDAKKITKKQMSS